MKVLTVYCFGFYVKFEILLKFNIFIGSNVSNVCLILSLWWLSHFIGFNFPLFFVYCGDEFRWFLLWNVIFISFTFYFILPSPRPTTKAFHFYNFHFSFFLFQTTHDNYHLLKLDLDLVRGLGWLLWTGASFLLMSSFCNATCRYVNINP